MIVAKIERRPLGFDIGAQFRFLRVEYGELAVLAVERRLAARKVRRKALFGRDRLLDLLSCAKAGGEQRALPRRLLACALDISAGCGDAAFRLGDLGLLHRLFRFDVGDRRFGPDQRSLGLRDPGLIIGIIDFDQQIALFHVLEIVDEDVADIAADLRAERRHIAADIGVVGLLPRRVADPAVPLRREQRDDEGGGRQDRNPEQNLGKTPRAPCRQILVARHTRRAKRFAMRGRGMLLPKRSPEIRDAAGAVM